MVAEIVDQFFDLFHGLLTAGLHAFQAADGDAGLIHEKPGDGRFRPLPAFLGVTVLELGYLVDMLGAVVVVE